MAGPQLERPRLLEPLQAHRLAIVEAGGGYGKSQLAEQLRRRVDVPTARLALRPRHAEPGLLAATLLQALRAARLSDLAACLEDRAEPFAAVDSLLEALGATDDAVLVIVDDAHHLQGAAAAALERLLGASAEPHRLVLLGRSVPLAVEDMPSLDPATGSGAPDGATAGRLRLSATDLAFNAEEIDRYLSEAGAPPLSDDALATIRRATGGWPAAVVLWARAIASSGDGEQAVESLAARRAGLGALVETLLEELDAGERELVHQMAHLPLLSPQLVAAVGAIPDLYGRIEGAGLPLVEAAPGWSRFADPVAEHLTARRALAPEVARRAGELYEKYGEDAAAISILLAGGLPNEAAATIARLSPARRAGVGPAAIRAYLAELPEEVLEGHPEVWLQAARASDSDGHWAERSKALRRGEMAARAVGTPLLRELIAEQAFDHLREGRLSDARRLAEEVLAESGEAEHAARSRALVCAGRLEALSARSDADFEVATQLLQRAVASARRAGDDGWTGGMLLRLAEDALRERCRYDEAIAAIDEALALFSGARNRAMGLCWRCDTLLEVGRTDEAEAGIAECVQLGRLLHDDGVLAYAAWSEMELAVQLGDRRRLASAIGRCEQRRGDWFSGFSGVGFLADAADALDRLGLHDEASAYLERARERRHQDERQFSIAEACIVARSGDPAAGRQLVRSALGQPGLSPRRRWRLGLLDASAALATEDASAKRLAADTFDACLELGWPQLPLVRERPVAERLLSVAIEGGSLAARSLAEGGGRSRLRCLGELVLSRQGHVVGLPAGRPARAVMAVAAAGGSMHAEELIDILWPEADLDAGRGRLRNVMSRVNAVAPGLLDRQGEMVRLGEDVEVDLDEFEAIGRQSLALEARDPGRAMALAHDALALYRGPAFRDARYETWAMSSRDRARSLHLDLLDLLARDAEQREQVDEAIRLLEQAIAIEPYDEVRYLKAAGLLRSQGRVGSARSLLQRCRDALGELGIEPALAEQQSGASSPGSSGASNGD